MALLLPLLERTFFPELGITSALRTILIFAILGIGLNLVTGYTGLLNLGAAAFMAIGAYAYGISTCDIYPFQLSFWSGAGVALVAGALVGALLGIPAMRLRGDYLAIVTLGFGEIVQDLLRNLEEVTKGTQGINPLPYPVLFGYELSGESTVGWYYLLLAILAVVALLSRNLTRSGVGRSWIAIREDELAARCMGVRILTMKLLAFSTSAALCSLAGALWVSMLGSTGEPGNYDFQISMIALCIIIVGGLGTLRGALGGAVVMMGLNSVVLAKLSDLLTRAGLSSTSWVYTSPSNWKYMLFGLALIVVMRVRPHGLFGGGR